MGTGRSMQMAGRSCSLIRHCCAFLGCSGWPFRSSPGLPRSSRAFQIHNGVLVAGGLVPADRGIPRPLRTGPQGLDTPGATVGMILPLASEVTATHLAAMPAPSGYRVTARMSLALTVRERHLFRIVTLPSLTLTPTRVSRKRNHQQSTARPLIAEAFQRSCRCAGRWRQQTTRERLTCCLPPEGSHRRRGHYPRCGRCESFWLGPLASGCASLAPHPRVGDSRGVIKVLALVAPAFKQQVQPGSRAPKPPSRQPS
jgi:hypothetical protein